MLLSSRKTSQAAQGRIGTPVASVPGFRSIGPQSGFQIREGRDRIPAAYGLWVELGHLELGFSDIRKVISSGSRSWFWLEAEA